jgi:hypothetical protein
LLEAIALTPGDHTTWPQGTGLMITLGGGAGNGDDDRAVGKRKLKPAEKNTRKSMKLF